jgi:5'-3' exonuclease
MRKVTYDEAGVRTKFGVAPQSIPDYLALVGDSSDGYPGLPGWGSKSAAAILDKWVHLEAIPDSPLEWEIPLRGAVSLAATLRDHRAEAALYKRLATLNADAQIGESLDELEWRGVQREPFVDLCAELGFETVGSRVHRWA